MVAPGEKQGNRIKLWDDRPVALWATGIGTPLRMNGDNDARIPRPGAGDQTCGQDGWLVGMEFANFVDLGDKLAAGKFELPGFVQGQYFRCGPIRESQVAKLAIMAHGAPGAVDIDNSSGRNSDDLRVVDDPKLLTVKTIDRYAKQFEQILWALSYRARLFFMCCRSADSQFGEDLLAAVSRKLGPKEVYVIGYRTVLYCNTEKPRPGLQSQYRVAEGGDCYPGARETHYDTNRSIGTNYADRRHYQTEAGWNDLARVPWASMDTPYATIAWAGSIIKRANIPTNDIDAPAVPPPPAGPAPNQLYPDWRR